VIRLVAGLAAALVSAGAAQAAAPDDLIPEFRRACRPPPSSGVVRAAGRGDFGVIEAAEVRNRLLKTFPSATLGLLGRETDARSNAEWLADRALAMPRGAKDDDAILFVVARMVREWMRPISPETALLPIADGGLMIRPASSDAELSEREVLIRIFEGRDEGLNFICRDPEPAPPEPTTSAGVPKDAPNFVLVKTADDLAETDIAKKSFAEFSYADNRQVRVQSWGVQFAAGLSWPEKRIGGQNGYVHWSPNLYIAYERKGENDPSADGYVNNLDFGTQISGDLGFLAGGSRIGYWTLSAELETDDHFESRAYGAELRIDPPLPPLPYFRAFQQIGSGRAIEADARWTVDLIADWSHVANPGGKQTLLDRAEYARLGYDAGFQIRVGPSRKEWRLAWSVLYQLRDGRTRNGGDAQLLTSSLLFEGRDETKWAFGLSYERGENLQSFEPSELWKFILGLRF
jgi:hypothetical protein